MALDQRLAVRKRFRHFGKLRYGREQRFKIAQEIPNQAICHIALEVRVLLDEAPKTEGMVVKGVYEPSHALNALAQLRTITRKLGRGEVACRKRSIGGVGGHLAAAQRQENA